jgi:polysaccharide chain length determinant protein (PEP-CTERM system associated)
MTQDFEEQNSGGINLAQVLGIAKRRYLHFLIPLFLGWLIVWGSSWFLSPRYRSGTLILVEQPTMPKDYVTPNVSDDLGARLQNITQEILSRTRLLHIIDEFHLYESHANQDDKVERMRKDIDIQLVRDATNQVTAFNVYYTSGDPNTAQQVTSELTNLFINKNLEVRQQQSEDTTKFLADQLEIARKNLADQEEKVRVFKSQHMGELPGQLNANLQILSGLQGQLQGETDALTAAKQQHAYLQSLYDQYRTLQISPKSGDGSSLGLPAIDDELSKEKAQLADLSSRYTERHPDVRKLKEQIAKTEKMREQIVADLKARSAATQDNSSSASDAITTSGTPSPMAQIKSQLQANELEISNRERSMKDLSAKIGEYQARLNQEPIREQQLADLTRGYDQSKSDYDDLLKKKNESQRATSMELVQQGERFRILDPPSLPVKPDFPNRLKFCGFGLAFGLALGLGVVALLEMTDDRLHSEKEIKDMLPVGIIAEIPLVVNVSDQQSAKRKMLLGWATAAVVFATILVGSAFSYLHG